MSRLGEAPLGPNGYAGLRAGRGSVFGRGTGAMLRQSTQWRIAQYERSRSADEHAENGERERAYNEPHHNPRLSSRYSAGCASVAGGLVSRMTGKSSGCSFIAQAPNNTVEARQSAVTVPVNAVLMARALRSIFASH